MAEAKKSGASRYDKSPKIEPEPSKGHEPEDGGAIKGAEKDAERTAGDPKTEGDMTKDDEPGNEVRGDVMKGTDGIETHHTQSGEREMAHGHQMTEKAHQHGRHEKEHLLRATGHHKESHEEMNSRHHAEMRSMHSRHEKEMKEMGARHASSEMTDKSVDKVGDADTAS